MMLIGIDIGTQGTKTALFDREGACLATAFQESRLMRPAPGVVEEDPEVQLRSVLATIKECLLKAQADPSSIAALAIDGQMAGIIGVDREGRNVTPYDSWLDTRCAPYIDLMDREAGEEVIRKAGAAPSFNHGPKILWWMKERPQVFRSIRAFVTPAGYAAMRLCGLKAKQAFMDKSYLHFSGFADNARGNWDSGLCRHFGLDSGILPRIVDSHRPVGELTAEMAGKCGLRAGTTVVAGCGDTAASFLACGATQEGICVDVAGTASVFASTTAGMSPDLENRTLACGQSATPGLWHPYAYINGGGMNLEWFRSEIAGLNQNQSKEESFEALNRALERISPRSDDPLFIPHLGGRVCPSRPSLRGAWLGLTWSHTQGHLYRAVLEGVALEYGIYLEILGSLYSGFKPKEVRITGGGGKSSAWNHLKADVLGVPVVRLTRDEGAPLGAALLAGFGAGVFRDLAAAAGSWVETGEVVQPQGQNHELYRRRIRQYRTFMDGLAALHQSMDRKE